ncbi:hypothetical protein D3C86_1224160 [compost metagenome]
MTNVYEVFKEYIWLPDDLTDCLWYEEYRTVYWTEGDCLKDLFNGDGDTYSCEVYSQVEKDGYVMYTLFDGCGNKVQSIFSLDKKQDQAKFWKEFEEEDED